MSEVLTFAGGGAYMASAIVCLLYLVKNLRGGDGFAIVLAGFWMWPVINTGFAIYSYLRGRKA